MIIVDVREKDEFEAEHIPDSIHCPLSQLPLLYSGIMSHVKEGEVMLMCRSGNRAKLAKSQLESFGVKRNLTVYEGGIVRYKSEGNKVIVGQKGNVTVMRQVLMVASSLILLSFLASFLVHPNFVYISLFVGAGLALAGFAGFCPMMIVLQKMPWNTKKV